MNFWKMFDFLQERSNNIPSFTWWQRERNNADNNWHNIVQKLAKGRGGEIFYKNGRG